jgi:hypothetical protein
LNELEALAEGYRQFGSTSAVIGGLAFAAATSVLASAASSIGPSAVKRSATITAGASVASAACLVVASLAWTFLAVQAVRAAAADGAIDASVRALNRPASAAFILGFVLFFVAVGASGWIGSRRLGIFTTAVGALAGVAGLLFVLRFSA